MAAVLAALLLLAVGVAVAARLGLSAFWANNPYRFFHNRERTEPRVRTSPLTVADDSELSSLRFAPLDSAWIEGRLTGVITSLNERSGQIEPAPWVDCACPDPFSEEQLAVITTEWAELDESKLRQALSESGGTWRKSAYERFHAYSAAGGAETLPADAQAGEAKACAIEIAQAFVRDCGLGESRVIKALRPEDEARSRSMSVAPETRAARAFEVEGGFRIHLS